MNALTTLTAGLAALGQPTALGWILIGVGLVWLNSRAGLPRSRRDLQWRAAGGLLFLLALVLDMGRGLVSAWPWPPQAALLGALIAPTAAGWLFSRGRWLLAFWVGLSVPFFVLITLTAFFDLWLDLALVGGAILALSGVASLVGAVWTRRTPPPVGSPFVFGQPGGGFGFGAGGVRWPAPGSGARGATSADDVVDVEARTVDEARPMLPRRDD